MKYRRIIVNRRRQLQVLEEDLPTPRAGEVRVKVLAAGVSFADVLMRQGIHPEARRPPFTPGWDVVATVDALGEGVQGVPPGTTVAAMPIVGGYAEYLCLPETELVRVPPQLDAAETVCLILNYVTAYQMLHRSAQARPGETTLILSAAGGVGTALLQLARLHGVQTYGTASIGKLKIVESLGGHAIDYKQDDFLKRIRSLKSGGVDMVFDGIGGWNLVRSWRALARGGRLVAYGLDASLFGGKRNVKPLISSATGAAAAYTLSLLNRRKRLFIYSIQMLKRRRPDWFRQDLQKLFDLLARGELKPVIDRKLPLEQAALAHELLGKGQTVGKIVLLNHSPEL
ncbi:MAG TPA: medium chain dehydrogenase/reductase family protein [Tepidisphaeraceae bacterium]|jgi:NADPH2:quinone reductase|nr:medium chain dehydrogenase/reductase family protein [Tepidisphaeraceae bacterium]